jgi:hypothetical protein
MYRLLINGPSGEQQIIQVGQGGNYFDQNRVIWDERIDGKIPNVTLGKMVRNGKKLDTLADYLPDHAAYVANQTQRVQAETKKAEIAETVEKDKDLEALRQMTDAEIDGWFAANVTSKVAVETMLKKVVKALIKQEFL